MRIALAQLNPTVGDVRGNTALVLDAVARARADGADLVVCPEMALLGYPPRDLLLRAGCVEPCEAAVRSIADAADGITVVVGHPRVDPDGVRGVRNGASVVRDGRVLLTYDKRLLPGYDVFDEDRYFDPGTRAGIVDLPTGRVGVAICEDLWRAGDVEAHARYVVEPLRDLKERGCEIVVALNASPFVIGKFERHVEQLRDAAVRVGAPIVAVNQVGGNDDLVFDGRSVVVSAAGEILRVLPAWTSTVETVDVTAPPASVVRIETDPLRDTFDALVLGVRDYCRKTGHDRVLLGLSGGIDSALVAAIATAALGPAHVTGVIMPSRYSSEGSVTDARALAEQLGLEAPHEVPIEAVHAALRDAVAVPLDGPATGLTDENLQARARGTILMALSNAGGALVLATGNKSELAVGYTTLYGDMCGALSVIGDVAKTRVYALAEWLNEHHAACGFDGPPIPRSSITKPPSAELRPDQTDQDSLPPYETLDAIMVRLVEREQSIAQIVEETGTDEALVRRVAQMLDRNEYKRFQAAIILKVTPRAFGRGREMPIVMRADARSAGPAAAAARRGDRATGSPQA